MEVVVFAKTGAPQVGEHFTLSVDIYIMYGGHSYIIFVAGEGDQSLQS